MISTPLLKQTIRSSWIQFLIFMLVPCVFLTMVMAVYTTKTADAMQGLIKSGALPPAMTKMIGSSLSGLTLNGMLATQFFQMLAIIFPMIYIIIVGNKLIASRVDRGDMAYILSTPTKRNTVTLTQALYLFGSLAVMFALIAGVGLGAAAIFQPNVLIVKSFLYLVLGAFLLSFATSGITFASSCIFNLSKNSIALGAGFPLAFFVCNLVAQMGDSLKNFKYFSLQTLYNTNDILAGKNFALPFIILTAVGVCLYALGMVVFRRKDLPL